MDVGWGVQPEPGVAVVVVDQAKNVWQCCRAASTEGNRVGKSGRYFSVLNCASELSRIRDNSDYAGSVIMPSMIVREGVCAGRRAAAG